MQGTAVDTAMGTAALEIQKLGIHLSNRACRSDRRLPKASAFSWLCSRLPEARLETRFEEAIVWKMTPVNTRGSVNFRRSHLGGEGGHLRYNLWGN